MNNQDLKERNNPKTTRLRLGSFFPILNSYAHILKLTQLDTIKEFNEKEAELISHMQMFDASSLLSVSDLKGNIIYANDKFCKVSKYSREEILGKPHNIIRHPDTPPSVFKELWHTIGNGKVWHGELKNRAKDGSAYWVLATIAPILGKDNKPVKYISMRVEISKQKLAEAALIGAREMIDVELHENVNYAKHVHKSFLTNEEDLEMVFPESFLIYKARKIISGDFYRVLKKNNHSIIILGDSTGHGVSASYISVVILNIITRLLHEGLETPLEILSDTHKEIIHIRLQNQKHPIYETADTLICSINNDTMEMKYASAKMKGVIIRKNEIIELKRDRCSVGELYEKEFALTPYHLSIEKGDCMYLFSDGMTDQIGGEKGKTFKYKHLIELLFKNRSFPMDQQKRIIYRTFREWQGENEQTDDMTLLGIRIQ